MFVIGTAGHVDHGKSTLVKALTGIDPDRLQEEKAREMTIDLGFAWLKLPSGREVSIVDVPGHERFIKNMLAGVGGIDAAILVIAADEGVMPQTKEHLAILDLLGISKAVVALTKVDLVDEEWLSLVHEDVLQLLKGTVLEESPIVYVSSRTGKGLDDLVKTLDSILVDSPRSIKGVPRLPIDRVFTIRGFGTVVTGTLIEGSLILGQEVEILPTGKRARIRGLQSHKNQLSSVGPGRRVAVNLSGVDIADVQRGDVLVTPGKFRPTKRIDVYVRAVRDLDDPITHADKLEFFSGTTQSQAVVSLLGIDSIDPGSSGYAQLRLSDPVVVSPGDYFILRKASPSVTVGGGTVLSPYPKRHKRSDSAILQLMNILHRGGINDKVVSILKLYGPMSLGDLLMSLGYAHEDDIKEMITNDQLISVSSGYNSDALVMTREFWDSIEQFVTMELHKYHNNFPLRKGMPKEELRKKLPVPLRFTSSILHKLAENNVIKDLGDSVSAPDWRLEVPISLKDKADKILESIRTGGSSPPSPAEIDADRELLQALVDMGKLVKVSDDIYFSIDVYEDMVNKILTDIDTSGPITVARARDLLGTSRKYVLALLEYMDEQRITRRSGDYRVRR